MADVSVTFERLTEVGVDSPTLIEGFPGFGLVAAIAVEQITDQLDLDHHGNIVSESFPSVLSYRDGRARELVRVYSGAEHGVMTLQSDLVLPPSAFDALSESVHEDLAAEFDRAIFLAGAPARTDAEVGSVSAIATGDELAADLRDAGIEFATGDGLIGGITGALATDCYRTDVPAAVLVVRTDPYLPDPGAARSVIEDALEPLVDFDIDTAELDAQSREIRAEMEYLAEQYQQVMEQAHGQPPSERPATGMFQ